MDFKMTDEQELLKENIREWCACNITETMIQRWYSEHDMPDEIAKSWIEAGFGYMGIPEEYGGTSCDRLTLGIVVEELARATGAHIPFSLNALLMYDICEFGNAEQIKMCMDAFRETGYPNFSLAISEPNAGSDNMSMTTYTKEINSKIHINGQKTWVTNGEKCPYIFLVAKDESPDTKNSSMSLWLFPKDTPGVTSAPVPRFCDGIEVFSDMTFEDVVIDKRCLLGERGRGFMGLMKNFEMERCMVMAQNIGQAQACMDDAAAYVTQRIAFGKPISNFQLIQEKITDMEIKIRNSRNLTYQTLWEIDNKMPVQISAALMKRYAGPATTQVCDEAIQIFGGLGFTKQTRVGRCMLDCRGMMIGGGTIEIMVHIAGRALAKKYAKAK
jgi:alkylation response protein AidB-like acyl-CoA dehydrogenase